MNRREFLKAGTLGVASAGRVFGAQKLAESLPTEPVRLHPENPHYFLWRGKPTVLITAGEHYGAVLNLDFDYLRYLKELKAHGFNLTRIFSGAYREVPGSFNIQATRSQQRKRSLFVPGRDGVKSSISPNGRTRTSNG